MLRLRPKFYKRWLASPNVDEDVTRLRSLAEVEAARTRRRTEDRTTNVIEESDLDRGTQRHAQPVDAVCGGEQGGAEPDNGECEADEAVPRSADGYGENVEQIPGCEHNEAINCGCFFCREKITEVTGSEDNFGFKGAANYADKLNLHEPLSPALEITKFEVLTMILMIVMRHGMTGPLISDLLKFVNVLIGCQSLPTTDYIFNKIFAVNTSLQYHFVCDNCTLYLGEHKSFASSQINCPNCEHLCNVKPSTVNEGSFFITLSVKDQLEELARKAGDHFVSRADRIDDGFIRDVYDGQLYKSLCQDGMPLSNPLALSLTIGTDGGQVFQNSSRNSMWPIQVVCNELSPSERFRPENMMLAGLWFGKNSPEMSAFLKPLSNELKSLETVGVRRVLRDGSEVSCPVYTILCVCDSVAKPKLQNIVQFNGYYGCGYCLQKGSLLEDTTNQVRYPFDGRKYPLRSEESVRNAMTIAQETAISENGVKGLSPLLLFSTIHLVFGIPIDYLHAVLLGVVKRLVGLFFDETSTGKRYYIKKFEPEIDKILAGITLPSGIGTRPKLISKRALWKGKDYLCFLLFLGLTCLNGYLPSIYLDNFRDLSNGIFLLLKDSISPVDLHEADIYLTRFLKTFNLFYGDRNMVYNIHLLSHLVQIVKLCGPLPMYSAFSFEGGIGLLSNLVKGTNSVASQICRKYVVSKSLPHLLKHYDVADNVYLFCEETFTYSRTKKAVNVDGITLLGAVKYHMLSQSERELFIRDGWLVDECVQTFNRIVSNGKAVTSRDYTRPTKTNDTCVQLRNGDFCLIEFITLVTAPRQCCVLIVTPLRICLAFNRANHLHVCAGLPYGEKALAKPSDILRKCVYFSANNTKFVSYQPNQFERD